MQQRPVAHMLLKHLKLLALAALCVLPPLLSPAPVFARELRDDANRQVQVPDQVSRIFPAGPPASLILYSLDPQSQIGWTRQPSPAALEFLGPDAIKPTLGWVGGRGGEANFEAVLRMKPDLIVDIGTTSGTYISLAERIEQTTHIPVLLLDGRIPALPATYRLLGQVLDKPAPANARAEWIETHLRKVEDRLSAIAQANRPKVYLARGASGLESARMGSINVEAVELAGGRNVVGEAMGGGSLVTVSMEQLLTFDPDVIVVLDPDFYIRMQKDPLWMQLRAVKTGRAVLAPQLPFPWVDYPPSVNRVMGVLWLAQLFHPEQMQLDGPAAAREFYQLFYHHELTAPQMEQLLKHAAFK